MVRFPTSFLLATLLVTGCTHILPTDTELNERVSTWVSEEQYGRALDALLFVSPSSPDYQQYGVLKKRVEEKAAAYEQRNIQQAIAEEQRDQWESAKSILKNALDNYPQSEKLFQALEQFRKRRVEKQKRIDLEITISRGEWLVNELRLREARRLVSPNQLIEEWRIKGLRSDAKNVSEQLRLAGMAALEADDLDLAKRTLPLANRLHGSPENSTAILQLEQRLETLKRIKQYYQELKLDREIDNLLIRFDQALRKSDLHQASSLLEQLEQLDLDNEQLARRKQQLAERITTVVQLLMQEGNKYYSQSRYEQAIQSWEIARSLAPENQQLEAQIERARRIISNLQELKEKSQ